MAEGVEGVGGGCGFEVGVGVGVGVLVEFEAAGSCGRGLEIRLVGGRGSSGRGVWIYL